MGDSAKAVVLLAAAMTFGCARQPATTVPVPEAAPTAVVPAPAAAEPPDKQAPATEDPSAREESETAMSAWAASGRGWLGVELEAGNPADAGVRVLRVVPGSPAARAGLQTGDVIVRLDNEAVAVPEDVVQWVGARPAGSKVSVMAKRAGKDRLVGIELGVFPKGDQLVRMTFVDQPAPPFEFLKTAQGSAGPTLGAHRGNVILIEFWAPWCVACRALIPHMNQWHERYGARGLAVIGITNERVPRAAAAAHELGMEYPILADETGRTTQAYQARSIPMVFVIDRQGSVRDVMIGYDSKHLAQLDSLIRTLLEE